MPSIPFWTTGLPRTPTPKDRVIRDLLARMQGKSGLVVGSLKVTQILTIQNASPELRFKEGDQVAPAGEWRLRLSGDVFYLEKSATAGFATTTSPFNFAPNAANFDFNLTNTVRLLYTAGLEIRHGSPGTEVFYTTGNNSSALGYVFGALNSSSVHTNVLAIRNATDPSGANFPYAHFINRPAYFGAGIAGDALSDLEITPNFNNAGTGRSLLFSLRNTAGGQITAWRAFPNGASPIISMIAPNIVPTTTQIPNATFLAFVINGADELVAYFNKAGAIISRNLGVLA